MSVIVVHARRPMQAGEFVTTADLYLRDDWAELLVHGAAFQHLGASPMCLGYTMTSSGRAWCGACGWGMSARLHDVGGSGSALFALAAIARFGEALALAFGELVQALFEAVLP